MKNEELIDVKERKINLVAELNNINLQISMSEKKTEERANLIGQRDKIISEIQRVNNLKKVGGINDAFRDIVNETCPQEIMGNILTECYRRMNGEKHELVPIYTYEDIKAVEEYRTLDKKYINKCKVINKTKDLVYSLMPDFKKTMSNSDYRNAVELQKNLQKIMASLNE